RKTLAVRHRRSKLLHGLRFKFRRHRLEDHHAGIVRIPDVRGRTVGNERGLIVAVEVATVGELHVHGADHREPHAVNSHGLAHRGSSAEQFLLQPRSQEHHTPPFGNVLRRNPSPLGRDFVAHFTVFRVYTAGRRIRQPLLVRNALPLHGLQRYALDQRRLRFHPVRIFLLEAHSLTGSSSARLFAGSSRPADDCPFAEHFECVKQHATESGTVTQQQRYRHNSTRDSRHRKQTAHSVPPQRRPSLFEHFSEHSRSAVVHSYQY